MRRPEGGGAGLQCDAFFLSWRWSFCVVWFWLVDGVALVAWRAWAQTQRICQSSRGPRRVGWETNLVQRKTNNVCWSDMAWDTGLGVVDQSGVDQSVSLPIFTQWWSCQGKATFHCVLMLFAMCMCQTPIQDNLANSQISGDCHFWRLPFLEIGNSNVSSTQNVLVQSQT